MSTVFVDFAEVHDAFSIVELITYEDLGLCKKGEAYKLIRDNHFNIDGKFSINVSLVPISLVKYLFDYFRF